jgi:D-serine deaminase-like pyridoxal phosphate-dependent protein
MMDARHDVIVSAGGSAYFDVVAQELAGLWPDGISPTIVLRSGAYVTHDDGLYESISGYSRLISEGDPRPALHLWAQVLSCPEPGVAILGFGKRDAPIDAGMPIPIRLRKDDGDTESLHGWRVDRLNDHHAYLNASTGATPLAVGNLVELGISHPCTAFDRWKFIPVVDADLRVIDCVETFF